MGLGLLPHAADAPAHVGASSGSITLGAPALVTTLTSSGVRLAAPAAAGRVLIVDDQAANVALLTGVLNAGGYTDIHSTTDPRDAVRLFDEVSPDIVLLDLHMPHMEGDVVLAQLMERLPAGAYLPVVVMTGDGSASAKERALSMGARDFLTKPFSAAEALLRIRNLLETRFLYLQLQDHATYLEAMVRLRTADLEHAHVEAIERLARAAEYRDDATGQHARRVGDVSALLARRVGQPEAQVELIRRAAQLHDIGKIGIPDHVLLKPGRYTPEERACMRAHVQIGARIVSGSTSPLLKLAEQVTLTHHERWDGADNITGLAGADIPLSGRIVAVADVLDALTQQRPYKPAWPLADALQEIVSKSGTQFDPAVVDALQALVAAGVIPEGAAPGR